MTNKKLFLTVAILLICTVLILTGCQPTPEVAPVVNKREELPQDAVKEEGGEVSGESFFEPVEYEVTDHWKETITREGGFTVTADADVKMPKVDKIPIERLERRELSQQEVDSMIAYFAGEDAKFFKYPVPLTKEYYQGEIIELKKSLAEVEAGGDGEDPEYIREYIKEAEERMEKAPEKNEIEYMDTKFTYQMNWDTGEPDTSYGENYINLAVEKPGGGATATIWASKYDPDNAYGPDFSYNNGTYEIMHWYEEEKKSLEQQKEWLKESEGEDWVEEERKYIEERETHINAIEQAMQKNTMDLDAAKKQVIEMLEEFGITGVQITQCDKALYMQEELEMSYTYTSTWEPRVPDKNACYVEFIRQSGGVPCNRFMGGGVLLSEEERGASAYSAPFEIEQGSAVIGEDGEIVSFYWSTGAQVAEQVAADSELISFEEAKKRAVDQLFFNSTYWIKDMEQEYRDKFHFQMRFELDKVELKMGYINAKDDPEKVLIVPIWCFGAQGYDSSYYEGDEQHEEYMSNYEEIQINALDGGVVMMAGIDKQLEQQAKWEAEEEAILAEEA